MPMSTLCRLFLAGWVLVSLFADDVGAIEAKSLAQINRERQLIAGTVANATDIAAVLARPGLTVINAVLLLGNKDQVGVFTGGTDSIGIASGVILSSGGIGNVKGPNTGDGTTSEYGGPGYAPLDAIVPSGDPTLDAAVLQIDFVCDSGLQEEFHLEYVWASEEYNEYVDASYNDIFAFFLNGLASTNNVALLASGEAVAINSVNCGNPYNPASVNTNCDLFVNNERSTSGAPYNISYDGFTKPLFVNAVTKFGTNTIVIAVGDVGDDKFDSAVMIGEGTLSCGKLDTAAPSKKPTIAATQSPSQRPTLGPSNPPVAGTTKSPTNSPTETPTRAPVTSPGTASPTSFPTDFPTSGPTSSLTSSPTKPGTTKAPHHPPTKRPTKRPSNEMTLGQCFHLVKKQCNCIMYAKGDDCADKVIRNQCGFASRQQQQGQRQQQQWQQHPHRLWQQHRHHQQQQHQQQQQRQQQSGNKNRVLQRYSKYCKCS